MLAGVVARILLGDPVLLLLLLQPHELSVAHPLRGTGDVVSKRPLVFTPVKHRAIN